jgi:hypothetical protein
MKLLMELFLKHGSTGEAELCQTGPICLAIEVVKLLVKLLMKLYQTGLKYVVNIFIS